MIDDDKPKNVLDDLFSRNFDVETGDGFEELSFLVYRGNRKPEAANDTRDESKATPTHAKPDTGSKQDAEFSVTKHVKVELKDTAAKIRVMLPQKLRKKISMERIVEYTVKAIVKEFGDGDTDQEEDE